MAKIFKIAFEQPTRLLEQGALSRQDQSEMFCSHRRWVSSTHWVNYKILPERSRAKFEIICMIAKDWIRRGTIILHREAEIKINNYIKQNQNGAVVQTSTLMRPRSLKVIHSIFVLSDWSLWDKDVVNCCSWNLLEPLDKF